MPVEDNTDAAAIQRAWLREDPTLPVESIGVITRIWQVAKLLHDDRRRTMRRLGMDEATRDLLATLKRAGEPYAVPPGTIAARCGVSAAAITQRVARAVAAGYVTRAGSERDGRGALVTLTALGHRRIDETVGDLLRHEAELVAGLDPAQRDQLARLLQELLVDLRARE